MEEAGNFSEAFLVYLKDASESLNHGLLVRGALSCSCAATCLAKMGYSSEAHQLYLEAAMLYEENADLVIAKSIRESLWCLEEAYEHFLLASDRKRAERVFYKHVSLVTRINPFQGEPIHSLSNKRHAIEVAQITSRDNTHASEITKTMKNFLVSKKNARTITNSKFDASTMPERKSKN
ncbi:MAG: hypothetical protein HMLIMOIP_001192 [Candidatus Nitrosomirales archaeon]|jgi:hypothetical protein